MALVLECFSISYFFGAAMDLESACKPEPRLVYVFRALVVRPVTVAALCVAARWTLAQGYVTFVKLNVVKACFRESATNVTERVFSFGPFQLIPDRRTLLQEGRPLRVGSRALDILTALVERAGQLVSNEELVALVWPSTHVDEANLRVHIVGLRKILGEGRNESRYISNVPGRGYCFVAKLEFLQKPKPKDDPSTLGFEYLITLPVPLTRMIGRADAMTSLEVQLFQRRFLTITGPGGIGKTTLAIALTQHVSGSYRHGVCYLDVASLTDRRLLPDALLVALGISGIMQDPIDSLLGFFRDKNMLLVLDSCDRIVGSVAVLAQRIFDFAPRVHLLVTSREPLRVEGERVHRLQPLDVPPASPQVTAQEAIGYSAVQLFVERAIASSDVFELNDLNATAVADICRRLDGIALAIELAAGRIDAFGVDGLAERLDDRFQLLTLGRRTALPRHRTLRATLDWSYELLPVREQIVLKRTAVFASAFDSEAVVAIAFGADIASAHVMELVANLVAKSLIAAHVSGGNVRYRLLETTQVYALNRLILSGERQSVARRHAEFFCDQFKRVESEWTSTIAPEQIARNLSQLDDVRAAIDWAFAPGGDVEIGIELTAAASAIWLHFSMMDECRSRVERALEALGFKPIEPTHSNMMLFAALATATVFLDRGAQTRIDEAWRRTLEFATALGETQYRLRALWGLWLSNSNGGRHRIALELAEQFSQIVETSAVLEDLPVGERMMGSTLQMLGNLNDARFHIERAISRHSNAVLQPHFIRFHFDQRVMAQTALAEILWLQGLPDQALAIAETNVEEALLIQHPVSLSVALGQSACPVALWAGDLVAAERFLDMLIDASAEHGFDQWHAWTSCINSFRGVLMIKRGDLAEGLHILRVALTSDPNTRFFRHLAFRCDFAEVLCRVGEIEQGLLVVDEALQKTDETDERWCVAELLRIKAELILRYDGRAAKADAERYFRESLDWAKKQGSLSWELRTATSFAGYLQSQARGAEGQATLMQVYSKFTEGFGSTDMLNATTCLKVLRNSIGD